MVTAEKLATIKEQEYLRISEAAILTRKSRKTIYDALYKGDLECLMHGQRYLIPRAALDDWMHRISP